MSALCQKPTFALFDHLIGEDIKLSWDCQAKSVSGLAIDR
jgi:hypothetical protein